MELQHAVTGETINVAFDELALFFNNATIAWGWGAYRPGMSKDEFIEALQERMFSTVFAEAFAKEYYTAIRDAPPGI